MSILGIGLGSSNYQLVPAVFYESFTSAKSFDNTQMLFAFLGGLGYVFAGLAIANSQKLGWKVGVAVAGIAVALPVIVYVQGVFDLGGSFLIGFIFDVALLVALVHPQSREYQKVWFEGPSKRTGPRR